MSKDAIMLRHLEQNPAALERHRALIQFRLWEADMIRRYGPLYYRKLGYTLH